MIWDFYLSWQIISKPQKKNQTEFDQTKLNSFESQIKIHATDWVDRFPLGLQLNCKDTAAFALGKMQQATNKR